MQSDEERENILNKLREEYHENKAKFDSNVQNMDPQAAKIERVLLRLEESIYFNVQRPSLAEIDQNFEKEFLLSLRCCGRGFNSYIDWEYHLRTHRNDNQPKQEVRREPIFIAEREEPKERMFRCEIKNCNKSYTSAYGLRYHTERGHKVEEDENKPYQCSFDDCNKRYKNSNGLKYHETHGHK